MRNHLCFIFLVLSVQGFARALRALANLSNRCAVSEPLSARPASMLRILANPLCKGSSAAGGEGLFFLQLSNRCAVSKPLSARPASVLRTLANQTPLGEACKHAPHTCKSLTQGRLILIKPAPQAHLFSSIFSLIFYLKKPALDAGFFIKV